ncbi:transglutaminase-like cysteine peptidase [Nitratireductor sp. StC3]|uniref:transglutaminase-like cysteine peptidase n=1 Tax=Nitratireductor sp. StC3 TaxID=2126741 RepID=UPI000D0D4A5B|nr:transglutaminase-like cysteine peptidase [Nitratireductor sp. StC3]PSM16548.1 transglutaminase [Nitratireductor sp. StC3]
MHGKTTPGLRPTILAALLVAGSLAPAAAQPVDSMVTGSLTSQPIGHYEFCKANPRECSIAMRDRGPARLTKTLLSTLSRVNVSVNRAVKPMNDIDIFGKDEVWSYPDGVGDCEDYVLEKRRLLQGKGVSLTNLLITVVRKPDGEGHAVLTVRTDKGDLILDNLRDDIRPWSKTGYRFLKRQASNHTGRWVNLHAERNRFVGSVNR